MPEELYNSHDYCTLAEEIVGHKIPSNVVFCPNCEKDVECIHTAELYECKECGEDFAKYIVSRKPANSDVSVTQDVLTDIKTGQSIENTNPDYYKQEIARLNAERRWIPVSERLPEMYHPVLTMAKKAKYPRVLSREKGADDIWVWALRQLGGYVAYIGEKNITHWMPLPEPPESEV
jgi:predicted RNA-binding Zn-ribbon protein involved in translation (DUF1610 family)